MLLNDKVIWSEGLLLQPQHFQQQERYLEALVISHGIELKPYAWGIQQLKIDERLLSQGKFSIIECRGRFADGTIFDIPFRDRAPLPLDVPEDIVNKKIYLALPLHDTNALRERNNSKKYPRYSIETIEIEDTNESAVRKTAIQIGKLSFRLILEDDDIEGYSCIALAQILQSKHDRNIILDEQFIPPCINIKAVPYIERFISEIQGILKYRRVTLLRCLDDSGLGKVAEVYDFILLQLINRYEPLLAHFIQQKILHPEKLYRTFLQLLYELVVFSGCKINAVLEQNVYLHTNLKNTFQVLINAIRKSLGMIFEQGAIAIKLEHQQAGVWIADLTDKALLNKTSFVLAVHADTTPEVVSTYLPAQMKVAPVEEIRNLVHRALPGIELIPLSALPRQIPFYANFIYFSLNHQHSLWAQLENSAALAFHLSGDFPGLKLELWAIRNNK